MLRMCSPPHLELSGVEPTECEGKMESAWSLYHFINSFDGRGAGGNSRPFSEVRPSLPRLCSDPGPAIDNQCQNES